MTFPRIASSYNKVGATGLTQTLASPTGIMPGDLLIAYVASLSTTTLPSASTGWTTISSRLDATNSTTFLITGRIADGSADDVLAVTGQSNDYCVLIQRWVDHGVSNVATDITIGTTASGTTGNANPPNCNPGSAADRTWVAFCCVNFITTGASISAAPTSYTPADLLTKSASSTTSIGMGVAHRDLNASSADPGTFTNTSRPWAAQTIAIPGGSVMTGLRIDACPPTVTGTSSASISTTSFTPKANSMLLAACAIGNSTGSGFVTGSVTDSLGSSWTNLDRVQGASGEGTVELWGLDVGAAPVSARTVTLDGVEANAIGIELTVWVVKGADSVAAGTAWGDTASANSGLTLSFTAATVGSLAFLAWCDNNGATAVGAATNTRLDLSFDDNTNGETYATAHSSVLVNSSTMTLGFTGSGTQQVLAMWEILPKTARTPGFALIAEAEYFPTTSTAVTVPIPFNCETGDLCVVTAIYDSGTTTLNSTPAGFTNIGGDAAGTTRSVGFYRVLTDADILDGFLTLPGDNNFNGIRYQVWFYMDQDPTTPINAQASTHLDASGSDPVLNFASVTPTVNGCDILLSGGSRDSGTSWTSPPASFTADQNNPGGFVSDWSGHWNQTTAAATGTLHVTNTGAANGFWATITIAVAPAGGGGTNFSQTVTDPVGITDGISQAVVGARTQTDPVGLVDGQVRASVAVQTFTDAVGLLDSQVQSQGWAQAVTDVVGLVDSYSAAAVLTFIDPVGLVDSQSQVAVATQTVTDPVGFLDSESVATVRPLTDPVGLVDSMLQVTGLTQTATDPIGTVDSYAADAVRPLTDPVGLLDSAAQSTAAAQSVTDPVGLLDSETAATTRPITDPVGLLDSTAQTTGYTQTSTDAIGLLDSESQLLSAAQAINDSVGISDSEVQQVGSLRIQTDAVGLLDSAVQSQGWAQAATDAVGLTDAEIQETGTQQIFTEAIGLTDSMAQTQGWAATATDPVGLTDAESQTAAAQRQQDDTVGIVDGVAAALAAVRTITESVGITDSQVAVNGTLQVLTDALGILDDQAQSLGFGITATDAIGLPDAIATQQDQFLTLIDSVGLTDGTVLTNDFVQLIVDALGMLDSTTTAMDWAQVVSDAVGILDPITIGGLIRYITDAYWGTDITNP